MGEQDPGRKSQGIVPLGDWDRLRPSHHLLVFSEQIDNRFQVEVQRIGEGAETGRRGTLVIFDHQNGDRLLFTQGVPLSYGAQFGPDIADVEQWEQRALRFIDEELPHMQR